MLTFDHLALYLTMFYSKREIGLRVGYLFVSAALAGSVGGLLAYGIGYMDGISGQVSLAYSLVLLFTFISSSVQRPVLTRNLSCCYSVDGAGL